MITMGYTKKHISLALISLAFLGLGLMFEGATTNGLCLVDAVYHDTSCTKLYVQTLGEPIFFFSMSLLLVSIALFFVREEVFKSWRRFAYWAVPISIIILWLAPTSTPGGIGISFLDFSKQTASWLVSSAFLLISLWIIVSRSLHATSK